MIALRERCSLLMSILERIDNGDIQLFSWCWPLAPAPLQACRFGRSADERDMHVYRRLPAGIAAEHIALHGGAQLSVTVHQTKGIEVAEHAAKQRNFIGEAGHFPKE